MPVPVTTTFQKPQFAIIRNRALFWMTAHRNQIFLAFGVAVVFLAMGVLVAHKFREAREKSWDQLFMAQYNANNGKSGEALQGLDHVLSVNRTGPLAVLGHLLKGDILLVEGKKDQAIASYQEASRQASNPQLKALAVINLATTAEIAGKYPEAEKLYEEFVVKFPENFLVPRAFECRGRVQAAQKKWAEAEATFEKLISQFPSTPWADNAQRYLTEIRPHLSAASR